MYIRNTRHLYGLGITHPVMYYKGKVLPYYIIVDRLRVCGVQHQHGKHVFTTIPFFDSHSYFVFVLECFTYSCCIHVKERCVVNSIRYDTIYTFPYVLHMNT